jgi:dienelactone hydrolase
MNSVTARPLPPGVLLCAIVAAASACVQPVRLARDDSPTMLGRQALRAPDPAVPGSLAVRSLYYGSGTDLRRREFRDSVAIKTAPVDGSKLAAAPTPALGRERRKYWGFAFDKLPRNGRVWYPEGNGPFPLVLVVHGNHNMKDFSDPGYEYIGRHLASRGFIVVSVDENFLNGNIRGENDARGWMLLQHLALWRRWNDSAGSPFLGKVAMDRIALIGHSRGGEAVAVAGAFNRLKHYPDDANVKFDFNFGVRSLIAIAPIDGQYEPTSRPTPLENVNYLVIHGSHDGDVSAFSGLRQYQRIRFTDGKPWFKSAVWMYRANHGQWNTVWGAFDNGPQSRRWLDLDQLINPQAQRRMALVYFSSFLEATLNDRREYLPLFRDHRVAGDWLPKTLYATRFQEGGFKPLASFTEDVDLTTGSAPGVVLEGDSLSTWRENILPLRWRNANAGHQGRRHHQARPPGILHHHDPGLAPRGVAGERAERAGLLARGHRPDPGTPGRGQGQHQGRQYEGGQRRETAVPEEAHAQAAAQGLAAGGDHDRGGGCGGAGRAGALEPVRSGATACRGDRLPPEGSRQAELRGPL